MIFLKIRIAKHGSNQIQKSDLRKQTLLAFVTSPVNMYLACTCSKAMESLI